MIFDSDRAKDEMGENYPFIDKNKELYTPKEALRVLSKAKMFDHIKNCIQNNGLERTEDMIKESYNTVPKLQEQMLLTLYEIWRG